MIFIALLLLIATIICFDYMYKMRKNAIASSIPGPFVYPLFGNLFIFKLRNVEQAIEILQSFVAQYGKIVRLWGYWVMVVVVTDLKALEIMLTSPKYIRKSLIYEFLRAWLGNGLLVSTGKTWFQRRKIITPTFHFKILEEFVEIFDEQSSVMVDKLRKHCSKGEFDVYPYVTMCALDIIAETALGTKINAQTNPNCEYAQAVHDMADIVTRKILRPLLGFDIIFKIFAPNLKRKQDQALKILHDFTEKIIEERRESLLDNNQANNDDIKATLDDFGRKRKMALLDVLLQSTIEGKPLSNADIREEVDTFAFEGHDTTTSGISFTLYCISRHPDIQKKVFDEIREVIGDDKSKSVSLAQLNDLKYLELVIKESMRFYPPVPFIGRMLEADLHVDGYTIPAGADINIPLFIIMKDPELFPDPEKFDPERFASEVYWEKTNPFAYIPFSAGPRNCIGQKFAMLEMKSTITKMLRQYELLPIGVEPKTFFSIVTRSKTGVNLGIKERVY